MDEGTATEVRRSAGLKKGWGVRNKTRAEKTKVTEREREEGYDTSAHVRCGKRPLAALYNIILLPTNNRLLLEGISERLRRSGYYSG